MDGYLKPGYLNIFQLKCYIFTVEHYRLKTLELFLNKLYHAGTLAHVCVHCLLELHMCVSEARLFNLHVRAFITLCLHTHNPNSQCAMGTLCLENLYFYLIFSHHHNEFINFEYPL